MDAARRFGELRSLLAAPASAEVWSALCALINDAGEPYASDVLVPYARDHLRAWPDALRVLTDATLDALYARAPAPALSLVRHLSAHSGGFHDEDMAHLLTNTLHINNLSVQGELGDGGAAMLAGHPIFGEIEALDLARNKLTDVGVEALMAGAGANLRQLDLSWNNMRDEGARAIAAAPLTGLTGLHLEGSWAADGALLPFKEAAFCGRLERLSVGGRHVAGAVVGWLGWPTLAALSRAGFFAQMTHATIPTNGLGIDDLPLADPLSGPLATHTLNIQDNRLSGAALAALAPVLLPPSLRALNLGSNPLSGEGVRALAARPLHGLESLRLTACSVDEQDVRVLLASQNMPALTSLHLDHNQASPALGHAIANRLHPFALGRLMLGYNHLTDAGVIALAQQPALASLHTLHLQQCELSAEACRALATSPYLRGLEQLSLNHNIIRDAGAAWLADGEWPALRSLELWRCGVSDAGARALARAPWVAGLVHLDLTDNPIYQEGRDALAASPHLRTALRLRFSGPPPLRRRLLPGEEAP
jgi:Ran GTPase-activating protein (RanGAP) involved in mRNA processing and transport